MRNKKKGKQGCCPDTHAKYFEIIIIVGFILSFLILTINILINLWFFTSSYYHLGVGITPIALNFINHILAISLRIMRSDGSVLRKNFSTSSCVSCFLLVFILLNLLTSLVEEAVYILYFLIAIFAKRNLRESKIVKFIFMKIMKMDENVEKNNKKEKKVFKLLPWVALNFNLFIQILNFIFIIILMGRIKLKSHFGFVRNYNNQSTQNKMINPKNKRNIPNGIFNSNYESALASLKKLDKRKKKFIKKRKFNYK